MHGFATRAHISRTEAHLQGFKQQPDAWQQCATFMQQSNDDNVLWYCLSVFEVPSPLFLQGNRAASTLHMTHP